MKENEIFEKSLKVNFETALEFCELGFMISGLGRNDYQKEDIFDKTNYKYITKENGKYFFNKYNYNKFEININDYTDVNWEIIGFNKYINELEWNKNIKLIKKILSKYLSIEDFLELKELKNLNKNQKKVIIELNQRIDDFIKKNKSFSKNDFSTLIKDFEKENISYTFFNIRTNEIFSNINYGNVQIDYNEYKKTSTLYLGGSDISFMSLEGKVSKKEAQEYFKEYNWEVIKVYDNSIFESKIEVKPKIKK